MVSDDDGAPAPVDEAYNIMKRFKSMLTNIEGREVKRRRRKEHITTGRRRATEDVVVFRYYGAMAAADRAPG